MINYLALIVSLSVSGVSAYYSIIGLTAIFSAAYWPIVIMGVVLEAGKLVTASWLYRNWRDSSLLIKSYLTTAVLVLMLITSMGTFGFLSKAHIDQNLNITTGDADRIQVIQSQIDGEKAVIDDLDKQVSQIDAAVSKLTDKGQAITSLQAADKQRKIRDSLIAAKRDKVASISKLNEEKIKLTSNVKKMEAEVGPIKYIAALIYGQSDTGDLERAVRFVIILLVLVFDPLAVVLLIAANSSLNPIEEEENPPKKKLTKKPKRGNVLKIDENNITRFIDKEHT